MAGQSARRALKTAVVSLLLTRMMSAPEDGGASVQALPSSPAEPSPSPRRLQSSRSPRRLQSSSVLGQFSPPSDGALSGHNIRQGAHTYSPQPDAATCAALCVSTGAACESFDFSDVTGRCYLGDTVEGADPTAILAHSTTPYFYYEKLAAGATPAVVPTSR